MFLAVGPVFERAQSLQLSPTASGFFLCSWVSSCSPVSQNSIGLKGRVKWLWRLLQLWLQIRKGWRTRKFPFEFGVTLRREVGGNMKLPGGRTPYFLGTVRHSFILDIFGRYLFPWGRFCPDVASGVGQGLASFSHGWNCNYLETDKRSLGDFFTCPAHIEPFIFKVVVGFFLEELGGLFTHG